VPEAVIQTDYAAQFGRGLWRYVRSRFALAGQDSFTDPPGQNEDAFERLLNVLPPVQGDLDRRWGYRPFTLGSLVATAIQPYSMALYANDPFSFRRLLIATTYGFYVVDEDGVAAYVGYNNSRGGRGTTSRGLFYWADSVNPVWWQALSDNNYLSGNWGLDINDVVASTIGPNSPTSAITGGTLPYTNLTASFSQNGVGALSVIPSTPYINSTPNAITYVSPPGYLFDSAFGFSVPTTQRVTGIRVDVYVSLSQSTIGTFTIPPDPLFKLFVNVLKTGVSQPALQVQLPLNHVGYVSIGGPSELFGTDWNSTDFATLFTQVFAQVSWTVQGHNSALAEQVTVVVDHVRVTLFTKPIAIALDSTIAGNITLVSGRQYTYAFVNSSLGTYSDLGGFSASSGPIAVKQIGLSNIPISADPQVDTVLILATADGGDQTTLYEVGRVLNGATTFIDDMFESDLLLVNQWQSALADGTNVGIADNTPPPAGIQYPTLHRGRMYVLLGNNLLYSKSDDELLTPTGASGGRFEQCFPALNQFPITNLGEIGTGLLSDGTVLYIGTDRRVIRLFGDGPATFLQPQPLFDNVGVLNQDVWKLVLLEGNPVGAMWLAPDYRVIGSDFNTYQDVGLPIQNVLDTINRQNASTTAWASYVGISVYNLFVLAVPTGVNTQPDTLLVFDVKGRQWFEWQLSDTAVSGFWWVTNAGVPQFVFQASSGKLYVFDPASLVDREGAVDQTAFTSQIRTTWLGMGDQTARKVLNEIEIMTGDSQMTLDVDGASSVADFMAPRQVVAAAPLVVKPRGELGVFLAGASTRDRFYRFTFNFSNTATTDLLRSMSIQGKVLHRI
jgi:hypothetical protein